MHSCTTIPSVFAAIPKHLHHLQKSDGQNDVTRGYMEMMNKMLEVTIEPYYVSSIQPHPNTPSEVVRTSVLPGPV